MTLNIKISRGFASRPHAYAASAGALPQTPLKLRLLKAWRATLRYAPETFTIKIIIYIGAYGLK